MLSGQGNNAHPHHSPGLEPWRVQIELEDHSLRVGIVWPHGAIGMRCDKSCPQEPKRVGDGCRKSIGFACRLELQQLAMQGSCPLHRKIRFRLDVLTHHSGQTREFDAFGRRQRPLDFLVNQLEPPLI